MPTCPAALLAGATNQRGGPLSCSGIVLLLAAHLGCTGVSAQTMGSAASPATHHVEPSDSAAACGIGTTPLPDAGESCAVVTLASRQAHPTWLAVDAGSFYWVSQGDAKSHCPSAVLKLPRHGGAVIQLATGKAINSLALGDDHVYWTDPSTGEVRRVAKAGGQVQTLAANQPWVHGLEVMDGVVIWLRAKDPARAPQGPDEVELWLSPASGGPPMRLADSRVPLPAAAIRLIDPTAAEQFALIYKKNTERRLRIQMCSVAFRGFAWLGKTTAMLDSGGGGRVVIGEENGQVTLQCSAHSCLWRDERFQGPEGPVTSIRADDANVYWTVGSERGAVMRGRKLNTTNPTYWFQPHSAETATLANDQVLPGYLIEDERFLYWTTGDGAIRRVCK